MKFKRTYEYAVKFLQNKRCKKTHTIFKENQVELEIQDLVEKDFPVAFVVHDYASIYPNAKTYGDFNGNGNYELYREEIRCYDGKLYKPVRVSLGTAISTLYEENVNNVVAFDTISHCRFKEYKEEQFYSEEAIIQSTNESEILSSMQNTCKKYKYCDGKFWRRCNEPFYKLYDGILFIEWCSPADHRLNGKSFFSALERDFVLKHVRNELSRDANIEVRMPEMVKLYHPKYFNVTVCCQAYYNSRIELPKNFKGTYDDALDYANAHLKEIPLDGLEYIPDSDILDEENCSFEE